jgi:hypothetical protein
MIARHVVLTAELDRGELSVPTVQARLARPY